jgi:hypothetical protein
MANNRTLTAPLVVIKRNGVTVAFNRSFNIQENYQRGSVQGLGSLVDIEVPPVKITCSASFDFYATNFKDSSIKDAINRKAFTLQDFVDNFLFADGIQLDVYKKVVGATNAQGLKTSDLELIGTIKDMFINSDSLSVSEGSVGSRSQSFSYLTPILFKDQD